MLRQADPTTRSNIVGDLQRRYGNLFVSRLIEGSGQPAVPLQRWAVTLPRGTTDCGVVVDWMNANSPHRNDSGWAKTRARFNWESDGNRYTGDAPDLTVHAINPRVSLVKSVDMPAWSPSAPVMQTAWQSMSSQLRAHEAQHEQIATDWQPRLQQRLTDGVSTTSRAAGAGSIRTEYAQWLTEHQNDQTAIDPYTALLECAAPAASAETTPESTSGDEAETV
jgi:predicted secreted Zn-dependent protease